MSYRVVSSLGEELVDWHMDAIELGRVHAQAGSKEVLVERLAHPSGGWGESTIARFVNGAMMFPFNNYSRL